MYFLARLLFVSFIFCGVAQAQTPKFDGLTLRNQNGYLKANGANPATANPTVPSTDVTGLAPSATTDTTNANNISSGTLAKLRLPVLVPSDVGALAPTGNGSGLTNLNGTQLEDGSNVAHFTNPPQVISSPPASANDKRLATTEMVQNVINGVSTGSYLGTWNASTNTPTITPSVGANANFYIVNVAGTTNINGNSTWQIGDNIRFASGTWQRIPNTNAVSSVAGRLGAVTLSAVDVAGLAASATTDTTNAGNIVAGTLALTRLPTIPFTQLSGAQAAVNSTGLLKGTGAGTLISASQIDVINTLGFNPIPDTGGYIPAGVIGLGGTGAGANYAALVLNSMAGTYNQIVHRIGNVSSWVNFATATDWGLIGLDAAGNGTNFFSCNKTTQVCNFLKSPTAAGGSLAGAAGLKGTKTPYDFGAVGDCATDDSTAVKNAFASGYLIVPIGCFAIGADVFTNLSYGQGVAVKGAGKLSRFKFISSNASFRFATPTPNNYTTPTILLEDFDIEIDTQVITGNYAAAISIITASGGSGSVDKYVNIRGVRVKPTSPTNYVPRGIYLSNVTNALVTGYTYEGRRSGSYATGQNFVGIDFFSDSAAVDFEFSNNHITYAENAINLQGNWQGARIHGNVMLAVRQCVNAQSSDNSADSLSIYDNECAPQDNGFVAYNIRHVNVHSNDVVIVPAGVALTTIPSCVVLVMQNALPADAVIRNNQCNGQNRPVGPADTSKLIGVYIDGFAAGGGSTSAMVDGNMCYAMTKCVTLGSKANNVTVGANPSSGGTVELENTAALGANRMYMISTL